MTLPRHVFLVHRHQLHRLRASSRHILCLYPSKYSRIFPLWDLTKAPLCWRKMVHQPLFSNSFSKLSIPVLVTYWAVLCQDSKFNKIHFILRNYNRTQVPVNLVILLYHYQIGVHLTKSCCLGSHSMGTANTKITLKDGELNTQQNPYWVHTSSLMVRLCLQRCSTAVFTLGSSQPMHYLYHYKCIMWPAIVSFNVWLIHIYVEIATNKFPSRGRPHLIPLIVKRANHQLQLLYIHRGDDGCWPRVLVLVPTGDRSDWVGTRLELVQCTVRRCRVRLLETFAR